MIAVPTTKPPTVPRIACSAVLPVPRTSTRSAVNVPSTTQKPWPTPVISTTATAIANASPDRSELRSQGDLIVMWLRRICHMLRSPSGVAPPNVVNAVGSAGAPTATRVLRASSSEITAVRRSWNPASRVGRITREEPASMFASAHSSSSTRWASRCASSGADSGGGPPRPIASADCARASAAEWASATSPGSG